MRNERSTDQSCQFDSCVTTSIRPSVAEANTPERMQNSQSVVLGYVLDVAPFSTQHGDKANGKVKSLKPARPGAQTSIAHRMLFKLYALP